MKIISMLSLKGGTGRTTVAAHLGAYLASENKKCLMFDLDPLNSLGHWFGMIPGERTGIARSGEDTSVVLSYIRQTLAEVHYMPFGSFSEAYLAELDRELIENPNWLKARLNLVTPSDYDYVILDTAAGYCHWTRQALDVADIVLSVAMPDAASYTTIPALMEMIDSYIHDRHDFHGAYFLLNKFDGRRDLDRSVKAALINLLGDSVLPMTVPYDGSVRESLAQQQTLFKTFPESQLLVSVKEVAAYLLEKLDTDPTELRKQAEDRKKTSGSNGQSNREA